jgi:DNA sulfur modification protein DndD
VILEELVLDNVGVFSGRQSIDLATSPRRPLVLLGALNGSGKTTLLNGLRLALYGSRAPGLVGRAGYGDFLRGLIHRHAEPNATAGVEVAFRVMVAGAWRRYRVSRRWGGERDREQLTVWINGEPSADTATHWAEVIEGLLPVRLSTFCFFDGEKLELLADPAQSRDVLRDAVAALLGLDVVDQLADDMRIVERRILERTQDPEMASDLAPLESALREADGEVQTALHTKGQAANRLERARQDRDATHVAFEQAGGQLREDLGRLHASRAEAAAGVEAGKRRLVEFAAGPAPLLLLHGDIARWRAASGEGIGGPEFMAILAERDEDVLDRLRLSGVAPAIVESLAAALAEDRAQRSGAARSVPPGLVTLSTTFEGLRAEIASACQHLADAQSDLDNLELTLQRVPTDAAVAGARKAWEEAVVAHARAQVELESATAALEIARVKRARAEARYTGVLERSREMESESARVTKVAERSAELRQHLAWFRERLARGRAARLGLLILECLDQLQHKSGLISSVEIDPTSFELLLYSGQARIEPETLSAGERQLLATATIWAILRASGRPLPLVIDTPLGRLDSLHREHLLARFATNASHQVLLLATDTEIGPDTRKWLGRSVQKVYRIDHDSRRGASVIVEGYFGEAAA